MKFISSLLFFVLCVNARSMVNPPTPLPRWYYGLTHDVNNVEIYVYNFGPIARSYYHWGDPGCWWPTGSDHGYIFGAGPWFGSVNMTANDTFVTTSFDTWSYWTECVPGTKDVSWESAEAIIYQYPDNWPAPQEVFYMAPQEALSDQDSWCAFNDLDPAEHRPGDRGPIGIEIYQTVYAWNVGGIENAVFVQYEYKNVTDSILTECFFGFTVDGDIGSEGGYNANDICAGIVDRYYYVAGDFLRIDNLAYQWQEEPEYGWDTFPGVFGIDLLQSHWDLEPGYDKDNDGIPDEYERDSSYYYNNVPQPQWDSDLDGVPGWRDPSEIPQYEMTALKVHKPNAIPDTDIERYMFLAGYDYETGAYVPYDTGEAMPRDQRFTMGSGPFELMPESSAVFCIGIMFAYWHDIYNRPDTAIVIQDAFCQTVFDLNWLLPGPPSPPTLVCVPGDTKITLTWNSAPEYEPDAYFQVVGTDPSSPLYDPFYLEYDFEGYRVWKSYTDEEGPWFKLSRCDQYNGIQFTDWVSILGDTLIADDVGLFHTYVDTDVRNGFTYLYAVTSFDQNYTKISDSTFKILRTESVLQPVAAMPRRDPANYIPGSTAVTMELGNERLLENVTVDITYPLDMSADPQYMTFGGLDWDWAYTYDSMGLVIDSSLAPSVHGYIQEMNHIPVDSMRITIPDLQDIELDHMFGGFQGLNVAMHLLRDSFPTDESIFDRIEGGGPYFDTLVVPASLGPFAPYFTFWGYRGNDYELCWTTASGGGKSVVVTDLHTGTNIPYKPYFPESSHQYDTLAHGWCFLSLRQATDTIVYNGQNPQSLWNTRWLYICGGLIALKKGGYILPSDSLPPDNDLWTVYARTDFYPMAVDARFRIDPTPAFFDTINRITQLNVKVVPNPYIVYNEWQYTFEQRRIRFINLPAECTIRVFTINGELLRTIVHHHTSPGGVINDQGGDEWWDFLSDTRNRVVSGVYIFHVQSTVGEQTGKFVIIR